MFLYLVLVVSLLQSKAISGFFQWNNDKHLLRKYYKDYTKNIMDTTVNPCDDFWEYSCGKWTSVINMPHNTLHYSVLDLITSEIQNTLNDTFSDMSFFKNYSNDDIITQTKKYYDSCINVDNIKERGFKPMITLINSLGSCPGLNSQWKEELFDLGWLIAQLRLLGEHLIISSVVDVDFNNSSKSILYIDQPPLSISDKDEYKIKGNLANHKRNLKNIILDLGGSQTTARTVSKEITDFEKKLAAISRNNNKRSHRAEIYEKKTIRELNKIYQAFNWSLYFEILWNKPINLDEVVFVETSYISQLMPIIEKTKKSIIFNFSLINFALSKRNMILTKNKKTPSDWWKICLNNVATNMDPAIGHIFIRRNLKSHKQNDIRNIAENIKRKFKDILKNSSWMDDETIEKAIHKIESIKVSVGLPEFMTKRSERKKIFKRIQIIENNFFESSIKIIRTNNAIEFANYLHIEPSLGLTKVNAYYDVGRNIVTIPAGILQLLLYHPILPQFQKYGIIGVIIAHEMVHALDNIGRNYDSNGIANTWWSNNSLTEYDQRMRCFIRQYNNLNVLGDFTLSENISDNVGIKLAFLAYTEWLYHNKGTQKLKWEKIKGLKLTSEQLFFVSFVQWRCEENLVFPFLKDQNNPHPMHSIRVMGTLANTKEFSAHFKCKPGQLLSPVDKCELF